MSQWKRMILAVCGLCLAVLAHAVPVAGEFCDNLDGDRYDCILALKPSVSLPATSAARVTLEWDEAKGYIQVLITRDLITITSVRGGKRVTEGEMRDTGITPGDSYNLTIIRRGDSLGLLHDGALIFHCTTPRLPGAHAGIILDHGWTNADEPRIQPLEAVVFADDFMRSEQAGDTVAGLWTMQLGKWTLKSAWDNIPHGLASKAMENRSFAQNPFAWVGVTDASAARTDALCTTGEAHWEDYTLTASVQPANETAVGVVVNMTDPTNGILVRWSPVNDSGPLGNQLVLLRLTNGKVSPTPLAKSPGGFLPGQWAKISVTTSLEGIQVATDDVPRITLTNITPWRGGVGLYADGKNGVTFDDITVYGSTLNTDLLFEVQQTHVNQRFQDDNNGMRDWSDTRSDWVAANGMPGQYWYRRDVFGDHEWMALTVKPSPAPTGELWMTLNGNGQDPTAGYRVVAQLGGSPAKITYTLYRDTTVLATKKSAPLPTGEEYTFRFWRVGSHLWLEVDDDTVIEATDATAPSGLRPAYRASGSFLNTSNALVLSRNMLDYTFSSAPTDWLTEGTWMPTIRWSCDPRWSFLAGWSQGDAVMWHKQRFTGDQAFEAFLGVKMEYPGERNIYGERYRDFCITFCGDGHNPRSGYTGILMPTSNSLGKSTDQQLVLLRNGVVVASATLPQQYIPNQGANHRNWFDLELRKHGATVDFLVKFAWIRTPNNELAVQSVSYTDPNPIEGGAPAIWSNNNGICVARARINFKTPPTPRPDTLVTIDDPWYPEWVNVNQPLTLNFTDASSTTGKPIHLNVEERTVPTGDTGAVKTDGTKLTLTAQKTGNHWYRISATDGTATSPSFHLSVPAFDPANNKRDDSHALILYRFDEGSGNVVHDKSPMTPTANLTIIRDEKKKLSATWLPGQGLSLNANSHVLTSSDIKGVDKLMTIAQKKACTIECWVSADTVYPPLIPQSPFNWTSCLFSWDYVSSSSDGSKRNLSVGQSVQTLNVLPKGGPFTNGGNGQFSGFMPGLLHLIITWDGTVTTAYINGKKIDGQRNIPWNVEQMTRGDLFILGKSGDLKFPYPFLGTFYLLAIHDTCFTEAQVTRHYLAGPSGK